jgi:tRNA pseudouridine13 synthase
MTPTPPDADDSPRFLTAGTPGIGGSFKSVPEDFHVDELPLYDFAGDGEHTFVQIEKRGISTFEATRRLAKAAGVRERDVGTAGLKDARAVATQWVSLPGVDPARVEGLELRDLRVVQVTRHRNKLRRGHLAGNRFTCVLRGVDPAGEPRVTAIVRELADRGVPNYFGNQRFGGQGDTHRLGLALVRRNQAELLRLLLGRPEIERDDRLARARAAFDTGDWPTALDAWPPRRNLERRLLKSLIETDGDLVVAEKTIPVKLKRLYVSALQSELFNRLLADRLPDLVTLRTGDVAYLHRNGAAFVVEDAGAEQPRADAFEISPSGPLVGTKWLPAEGEPGRAEHALLDAVGLSTADFKLPAGLSPTGARRPYRFPLGDATAAWNEPADGCVTLSFTLPPGCYATNVLAEVAKGDQPPIVPD